MRACVASSNKRAGLLGLIAALSISAAPLDTRLDLLQREDARVAAVFLRLATAGDALCRDHAPQPGWVIHHAGQYGAGVRAAVVQHFGLDDHAALLAVVPNGPAERSGLRADDRLIAVNGLALPAAEARERIGNALRSGPARLSIERDGIRQDILLTAPQGCAGRIQLVPDTGLEARGGDGIVTVTTSLVEFARSDDELAFVIGHELAHVAIVPGKGREAEAAADAFGLRLAARAGYDPAAALAIVARLAKARGQSARIDFGHAGTGARLDALRRTIDRIGREPK